MSYIEKITGELRALAAEAERAGARAAVAEDQARQAAARAASGGFAVVAAGLSRVGTTIAEIRGRLAALAGEIGQNVRVTVAAGERTTPEETIAELMPVARAADGVRKTAAALVVEVGKAQHLTEMVLQGGQPGPLVATLTEVRQILQGLVGRIGTVETLVEEAITGARRLGSAG